MARIRSIKPELLEDEKTASLSHLEWRLFVSCLLLADDHGNFRANPDRVKAAALWAHPREDVAKTIETLARVSLIKTYEVDGQKYAHVNGWKKHQKVDHPGKAACPGPELSRDPRETLAPDLRGSDLKGEDLRGGELLALSRDHGEEDREPPMPRDPRQGEVWPPWFWLRQFGIAWCRKYNALVYADPGDLPACGALGDLLKRLGPEESLRCQAMANGMFVVYLAAANAANSKHPFKWFVDRINSLRLHAAKSFTPSGVTALETDPETQAMIDRHLELEAEMRKGPRP